MNLSYVVLSKATGTEPSYWETSWDLNACVDANIAPPERPHVPRHRLEFHVLFDFATPNSLAVQLTVSCTCNPPRFHHKGATFNITGSCRPIG